MVEEYSSRFNEVLQKSKSFQENIGSKQYHTWSYKYMISSNEKHISFIAYHFIEIRPIGKIGLKIYLFWKINLFILAGNNEPCVIQIIISLDICLRKRCHLKLAPIKLHVAFIFQCVATYYKTRVILCTSHQLSKHLFEFIKNLW